MQILDPGELVRELFTARPQLVEFEETMNRFRLVLAFVFMLASTVSLIAYVALQMRVVLVSNEPHLVLWDVVGNDGLYLAIVLVLLGLGWLYFGEIFASKALAKGAATIDPAS